MRVKFIDWFAGIGGFRRGMELAGHECVGFCEFDKFATASYISMHLLTDEQRKKLDELPQKKRQKEILKDEYRNGEWYANDVRRVCAGEIIKGGTGYEYPSGGKPLPEEIEHIYPDYSLYPELCRDTAYGFLTRGCPRGCDFCIVKEKEGQKSHKVSDLSEFWNGQKNIVLLDPNMFACREWKNLSQQLIDSKAWVDFSQGCDIRIMTEEKAEYIKRMKIKQIHFAWDRYQDKDIIVPKFQMFQKLTGWDRRKMTVYVLCGFDTTLEQDLDRIYTLRDLGYAPYVMIYDKYKLKKRDPLKRMQRWVNSRFAFMACDRFEDYTA